MRCKTGWNITAAAGLIGAVVILSPPAWGEEHEFGGADFSTPIGGNDCVGAVLEITNPNILAIDHFSVHVTSRDLIAPPNAVYLNWYVYEQGLLGNWNAVGKRRNNPLGLNSGPFWEQSPHFTPPLAISQGTRTALVMCWEYSWAGTMAVFQQPGVPLPEDLAYGNPADGGKLRDVTSAIGPQLGNFTVFNYLNGGYHMRVELIADYDGDGWDDTVDCDDLDPELNFDDLDGDGYSTCDVPADCDDKDASLNWSDADGDGYSTCDVPADCDDGDFSETPADTDGDGVSTCDGDCDGNNAAVIFPVVYYKDTDGDGYGIGGGAPFCLASAPTGWSVADGDCQPANFDINPGALEACNGFDDDCDTLVDDDDFVSSPLLWYLDNDGDGYGDPTTSNGLKQCEDPTDDTTSYVSSPDDCNDNDDSLNWSDVDGDGYSTCGVPADCDDYVDSLNWSDVDGDGYSTCGVPADCNDGDVAISPSASEVCNGFDDDCDGEEDELFFSSFVGGGEDFSPLLLDGNYDSMGNPQFAQITVPLGGDPSIRLNTADSGRAGRARIEVPPPIDPNQSWTWEAYFTVQMPDNGVDAGYDGMAFVLLGADDLGNGYSAPAGTLPTGGAMGFSGTGPGGVAVAIDTSPNPWEPSAMLAHENYVKLMRTDNVGGALEFVELCPGAVHPIYAPPNGMPPTDLVNDCIILNPRDYLYFNTWWGLTDIEPVPTNQMHPIRIVLAYDVASGETTLSASIHSGGVASLVLPSEDWWNDPTLAWEVILEDAVIPPDAFDPTWPFEAGWTAATGGAYGAQQHRVDNIHMTCPVPTGP